MNLTYLKFFRDAAECKSISKAAALNFVTQSAVTQGIQKLEKAVGAELTTHQKHVFQLTQQGEMLYARCVQIFGALQELQEDIQDEGQFVKGVVKVVCPQSIAMSFILPAIEFLKENYPEVVVRLRVVNLELIHDYVKQGKADVGIVVDSSEFNAYDKKILFQGGFNIYHHKKCRSHAVLVDRKNGMNVELLQNIWFQKYGKELPIQGELDSWEVVAHFTNSGLFSGFFPDYVADRYPQLQAKKIKSIPYQIAAILTKGRKISRPIQAFLDSLTQRIS